MLVVKCIVLKCAGNRYSNTESKLFIVQCYYYYKGESCTVCIFVKDSMEAIATNDKHTSIHYAFCYYEAHYTQLM